LHACYRMAGTGRIAERAAHSREGMYSIDIFCYAWLG
jgi:hypothetical protein